MSRSKHPKYKGFTKYYGWCDMYWNDKCVNCPNFHNCHRGHNTRLYHQHQVILSNRQQSFLVLLVTK